MKLKICVKNSVSGLTVKVMCHGKGICVGYKPFTQVHRKDMPIPGSPISSILLEKHLDHLFMFATPTHYKKPKDKPQSI